MYKLMRFSAEFLMHGYEAIPEDRWAGLACQMASKLLRGNFNSPKVSVGGKELLQQGVQNALSKKQLSRDVRLTLENHSLPRLWNQIPELESYELPEDWKARAYLSR